MMVEMDLELYQKAYLNILGDFMSKRLDEIRGKTPEKLLKMSGQYNQIPVNLDAVLEACKIICVPTSFESLESDPELKGLGEISGLVLVNDDDVGLFYKKTDSLHRQRFTIAHELGHCCLHGDSLQEGYIEFRNGSNIGALKEIEASTFAGELLIPEHSLNNVINRLIKPSLKGLSDIFNVSEAVMRKRLEVLKIPYFDDKLDAMIEVE